MGSACGGGVKSVAAGSDLAHAVSFQDEAVGVVDEAVEDGVGEVGSPMTSCQCSTGTWLVTMVDAAAVAVVDDFEQIAALFGGQRGEPPVVEDEQLDAGDAA